MTAGPGRDITLAGAVNLRDLGGYPVRGRRTLWRRLLRSGGLHGLPRDSVDALYRMGLRTVIDLRHGAEHQRHPNPFADHAGVSLHRISLFRGLAPDALAQGDAVLPQLYREAVETRAGDIAEVLRLIADAPDGIVLFHCTAGKDRTGLIAAMILELCGMDRGRIGADYALTGSRIADHIPAMARDAVAGGIAAARLPALFDSSPGNITGLLDHMEARFSGVEPYLLRAGLSETHLERLRRRILEQAGV